MKIYNFDEKGYYLSETEAKLDPLESKLQNREVYLMPRNVTTIAPELNDSTLAKFNGDSWEYEDKSVIVDEEDQEPTLEEVKNQKILEIKTRAANLIYQKYPDYKQRNILMSGDNLNIADMNASITAIRNKSNELESQLNNLTEEEIQSFNIDFS